MIFSVASVTSQETGRLFDLTVTVTAGDGNTDSVCNYPLCKSTV